MKLDDHRSSASLYFLLILPFIAVFTLGFSQAGFSQESAACQVVLDKCTAQGFIYGQGGTKDNGLLKDCFDPLIKGTNGGVTTQDHKPVKVLVTAAEVQACQATISGDNCTINDNLVNSCRPWFLAVAQNYTQTASDEKSQMLYFEQRIGKQVDIVRSYNPPGTNTLSADDIYFATRPNTILNKTWKPAAKWAQANGSNANVNADIDEMANSVKSVAPNKIMLVIHHEPENDVTGGADGCPTDDGFYKGTSGTPADYIAMWKNVRARFTALGVTNVVWVMNYMGYQKWDCMIKDMWPGNDLVDWVFWDAYNTGSQTWPTDNVQRVYNLLEADNDATHDFESKIWGLGETGIETTSDSYRLQQFANMKTALDNNTMPRLKIWGIFDSCAGQTPCSLMVGDTIGTLNYNQTDQNAFNAFADDPRFTNAFYR